MTDRLDDQTEAAIERRVTETEGLHAVTWAQCANLQREAIRADRARRMPSRENVQPATARTTFLGELPFVEFARYEDRGRALMVYSPEAWAASERGESNPGPIGFIPFSAFTQPASQERLTIERQAEHIAFLQDELERTPAGVVLSSREQIALRALAAEMHHTATMIKPTTAAATKAIYDFARRINDITLLSDPRPEPLVAQRFRAVLRVSPGPGNPHPNIVSAQVEMLADDTGAWVEYEKVLGFKAAPAVTSTGPADEERCAYVDGNGLPCHYGTGCNHIQPYITHPFVPASQPAPAAEPPVATERERALIEAIFYDDDGVEGALAYFERRLQGER